MKICFESLGCAKNLVDSEVMMGRLSAAGWELTEDPALADAIVVNTCSFIETAADESIDTILELSRQKTIGRCRRLVVVGCLPERFKDDIATALPEVDLFMGTGAFDDIVAAVDETRPWPDNPFPDPDSIRTDEKLPRFTRTPGAAYLKIAEGCSRHCTYCIIPRLRGRQKSRPLGVIVSEARDMIEAGAKELILVSQETTRYGSDLSPRVGLDQLLAELAGLSDSVWIRFLYGHPESLTDAIIDTVAARDNICSYFDLPVQHASTRLLKRMGRAYSRENLVALFGTIRQRVPGAVIRTTAIVGFPGETDADFRELSSFVEQVGVDHLGVFTYSDADDLPSHHLKGHVDAKTARKRMDRLMAQQMDHSSNQCHRYIGQTLRVLVEEKREDSLFYGRSEFQAPEVDGIIYIRTETTDKVPVVGEFIDVTITEAMEYDLIGVPS
ncbi:MAG: 30S ribosomal protein S12 methylthiotransferase RimO [Desulfobacteraceae bacterium]|nr:30S ribosomal protein S12 methylthiotransferase RimO [Desulfobacteraceae bacterium]